MLLPSNPLLFAPTRQVRPAPDGTFSIPAVTAGEYTLTVNGMTPNFYIKDVRLEQVDALAGISIADQTSGPLEITLSTRAGSLTGTVGDTASRPVANIQAVLIPERMRDRRDLYKSATTDLSGRFVINGLPPGDYRVYAWEDLEPFSYFDPEILKDYETQGRLVRIQESLSESIELKVIPAARR